MSIPYVGICFRRPSDLVWFYCSVFCLQQPFVTVETVNNVIMCYVLYKDCQQLTQHVLMHLYLKYTNRMSKYLKRLIICLYFDTLHIQIHSIINPSRKWQSNFEENQQLHLSVLTTLLDEIITGIYWAPLHKRSKQFTTRYTLKIQYKTILNSVGNLEGLSKSGNQIIVLD